MRYNLHTHTPRCMHASGSEAEYVRAAIENHYGTLGFADHGPWPFEDGFVSGIRMPLEALEGYVQTVRALGKANEGRIRVLCGLEYEYFPAYIPWLRETREALGLDYLILGNHFDGKENGGFYFGKCATPEERKQYLKQTIAGMETGLFAYVAHPDLFLRRAETFDSSCKQDSRTLCRAANDLGIPLEYNLLGLRYHARDAGRHPGLGYPCAPFWEVVAEENSAAILGVDAHHVAHLQDPELYDLAALHLKSLGVRRLESLPIG